MRASDSGRSSIWSLYFRPDVTRRSAEPDEAWCTFAAEAVVAQIGLTAVGVRVRAVPAPTVKASSDAPSVFAIVA